MEVDSLEPADDFDQTDDVEPMDVDEPTLPKKGKIPTNWHKLYQSFDEKGTKSIAEQ